jgi:autotransporter-associated beta strand protein
MKPNLGVLSVTALLALLAACPDGANGAVRTWNGSSNGNWSVGANWNGGGAPADGDALVFPTVSPRKTNTNDFPNLRLDSVIFTGGGYRVRGNPLVVTNGISGQQASGDNTIENAVTLGAAQTFDCGMEGTSQTFSGNITNAGFTLTLAGWGWVTNSGCISGTGGLTVNTPSGAYLSGPTANTYSGLTYAAGGLYLNKSGSTVAVPGNLVISSGSLGISGAVVLYGSDQIAHTADVQVEALGSFWINSYWATIDTLRGSGEVYVGTSGYLNVGYNNGSSTFDGVISGPGGGGTDSYTVGKFGTGTFTLTGNNTYLNGTHVSAGKLVVNGFQPQSWVRSDPDTTVAGTGTVGKLFAWGVVAPGSSPGILTCSNVSLTHDGPVATLQVELTGPVAGTDYDQLNARGAVNAGWAALNVLPNFTKPVSVGQQFIIINNDGTDAVSYTFDGLPEGASITAGACRFTISYVGGTGNDVVLTLAEVLAAPAGCAVTSGNGSGVLDPNECALLTIGLTNRTGTSMTGITATLCSTNPNVMVTQPVSAYPNAPANGKSTNASPFQVSVLPTLGCASPINLQLIVSSTSHGGFVVPLTLPSGSPSATPVRYDQSVVTNISDIGTIESTNTVAGWSSGPLTKVAVSLWLTHPIDSDLTLSLISPAGSSVTLVSATGAGANFGSACSPDTNRTTFDDSAPTAISAGTPSFLGTFRPQGSLATFSNTTPNGNWRLRITDSYAGSQGALRCWSLFLYGTHCEGGGACALCAGGTVLTNTLDTNSPLALGVLPSVLPTTCAAQTPCSVNYDGDRYHAYPFYNNSSNACITVTLTSFGGRFWSGSYLGAFTPSSPCANYLARGEKTTAGGTTTCGFQVPPNSVFTVVVMSWGGSDLGKYSLAVSGGDCLPLLNLQPIGGSNLDLNWPTLAGGYQLESSTRLATPTVWDPVTNVPIATADRFHLTNSTASPSSRFYRLHQP